MQGPNKIWGQGAWSTFIQLVFVPRTHQWYDEFLREQGFEDFLQIPPYTMSHGIWETLVRWFHTEMGTFHLSYGEYTILPLDWIAILGIRFGGYPISTHEMSFEMASELLGIPLPLIANMRGYFEPTTSP